MKSWGCLRCNVTWEGEGICWFCGDDETFIVGSGTLSLVRPSDGQPVEAQVRYF